MPHYRRRALPAALRVRWSKRDRALVYCGETPTGGMLSLFLEGITMGTAYGAAMKPGEPGRSRTLARELEARGYDLTTLRLQIRKKAT